MVSGYGGEARHFAERKMDEIETKCLDFRAERPKLYEGRACGPRFLPYSNLFRICCDSRSIAVTATTMTRAIADTLA